MLFRFLTILLTIIFAQVAFANGNVEFFEKKIRPVLVKHCYQCHSTSAKSVKGGLRLDSSAGLRVGGDSGSLLNRNVVDNQLLQAIRYESVKMPPAGRLPASVIKDFEHWVENGMAFPTTRVPPDNPKSTVQQVRPNHWAFQPILKVEPPLVNGFEMVEPIDAFVIASLKKGNVEPNDIAKPHILLRRVYFDLVGLPPSPEEVELFVQDPSDHVYSVVVDRLLSSPHFGERWGRHWLDLVRFAESNGGDRNVIWPHAWRYRNYVIDSFNEDKPFDRFVSEQVAGDLLPYESSEERDANLVATGMLTIGTKLFMETKEDRFKMDVVDDQIDVVTRAVLGLTVSCARCHDHKFDPIPTADYYALAGIFKSTFLLSGIGAPAGNQYGHDRPLQPIGKDAEKLEGPAKAWKKSVADQTAARNKARSDRYRVVRKKAAQENKLKMASAGKTIEQQKADKTIVALKQEIEGLDKEIAEWDKKIKTLDTILESTKSKPPQMPDYTMAVRDHETITDSYICIAGEYNKIGSYVPRGFLSCIPSKEKVSISRKESGRLQLAQWLSANDNPLTARVAVNRIWQHLFGRGLVETVDNFGVQGAKPTHPKLLDHLAAQFRDNGWSTKSLIRKIVTSRTYRMSSLRSSSENDMLVPLQRQALRRLEAEPLRDATLAASGLLNRQRPESSVIATFEDVEFNQRIKLTTEQMQSNHRSVYLPVARMVQPPSMKVWNVADPSLIVGQRNHQVTVDQQLYSFNNPRVIEFSDAMARRLIAHSDSSAERVRHGYLLTFGRLPTENELAFAVKYIDSTPPTDDSDEESELNLLSQFCQGLFASSEFRYIQ